MAGGLRHRRLSPGQSAQPRTETSPQAAAAPARAAEICRAGRPPGTHTCPPVDVFLTRQGEGENRGGPRKEAARQARIDENSRAKTGNPPSPLIPTFTPPPFLH